MSDPKTPTHDDEQLFDDVAETEDSGYLEVYLRFNDDYEKDYCFQIRSSTTFRDLFKIFDQLPIALRPNLFYHSKPIGFNVSNSPGYLTEDGGLLFDDVAYRNFNVIKDLDAKVSDHVWPGQLILPKWDFNYFGYYAFISLLLTWLYTDLPDFISPTPGICLTNQVSYLVSNIALYFDLPKLSSAMIDDLAEPTGTTAQVLFFIFHILKVLAIYAVINTGTFNPIKLWRFGSSNIKLNITKEELLELGWTGSRKASADEYKEYYREFKIKELGGMVPAHQAGLFETIKHLGVFLGKGEGYNTPLDTKTTLKDYSTPDAKGDYKLPLSYEYLTLLGTNFTDFIADKSTGQFADAIKQHRRYGLIHPNAKIAEIVSNRKKSGHARKF